MSKGFYKNGQQKFLEGGIAYLADAIKLEFVDVGSYTVDLENHVYLSDIPLGARLQASPGLASKTSTDGVADAADRLTPAVAGTACGAIVIFKDTGDPATSPLIVYFDTGTNLPFTPDGGPVIVQFDLQGIFEL